MAWWDFIKALSGNDEERRRQRQSIQDQVSGFVNSAAKVGGDVAKGVGNAVFDATPMGRQEDMVNEVQRKANEEIVNRLREMDIQQRQDLVDNNPKIKEKLDAAGVDIGKTDTFDKLKSESPIGTKQTKDAVDFGVSAARSVARVPETVKRSIDEVDQDLKDKVMNINATDAEKAARKEADKANDSVAVTDPIRKFLYGDTPTETYQKRAEGNKEVLKGAGLTDTQAGIITPFLAAATIAGDVPSPKTLFASLGKEGLEKLAQEGTEAGVKKLLAGKFSKDVLEEFAGQLAGASKQKGVKSILTQMNARMAAKAGDAATDVVKNAPAPGQAGSILDDVIPPGGKDIGAPTPINPTQPGAILDEIRPGVTPPTNPVDDIVEAALPPGQRQRGLLRTTENTPQLSPETQGAIKEIQPQTYGQMNIKDTLDSAAKKVTEDFAGAKKIVFDGLDAGRWDDQVSSHAIELLRDANRRGDQQLAREIMDKAAPLGTSSGQANALWRTFVDTNTPDGMVKFAQNIVDNANKDMKKLTKIFRKGEEYTLSPETESFIRSVTEQSSKLADGPEKDKLVMDMMKKINEDIPPGASEMFDAYRYQNMLSGPRTQARNVAGNVIQAGATKPLTLATNGAIDWVKAGLFGKERQAYVKDVPTYYKSVLNGFGDALEEFKAGWAGDIQQPDIMKIGSYKPDALPKGLTVVGRAMEGADRFFQSLVKSGEFAVQKSRGVDDKLAMEAADKAAKYTIFRAATDAKNATGQGALLSKIDSITDVITKGAQKVPGAKWFVPFVQTPMNITKQMIELSPAGFATLYKAKGARRDEQVAKAVLGTAVTGIGAMYALQGNTTWAPPKDKAEREAFYSSGKKPYSIRIGDTWVPMISFGPAGYSLGIGAAVKDAYDRGEVDDNALDKLSTIIAGQANFFTQQTYLQGVANFMNVVSGGGNGTGAEQTLGSSVAFAAGQVIPLQGLSRYVNSIIDPVLRKKTSGKDTFVSDVPVVGAMYSKGLEANTNVFTGEEMKRNASDYVAPYSMGKDAANPEDAIFQEGVGEFYKIKGQVSKQKTKAQDYIDQALASGNYGEAYNAAQDYNDWVRTQFADWGEQYGDYASKDIQDMYDTLKISITGIKKRGKNALEKAGNNTINYK